MAFDPKQARARMTCIDTKSKRKNCVRKWRTLKLSARLAQKLSSTHANQYETVVHW